MFRAQDSGCFCSDLGLIEGAKVSSSLKISNHAGVESCIQQGKSVHDVDHTIGSWHICREDCRIANLYVAI